MISRRGAVTCFLWALTWLVLPAAAEDLRTESLRTRFPAKLLHTYRFADREPVCGVGFLRGETRVAAFQETCRVSIVNLTSGRTEQTWSPEDRHCAGGLAVSPDGKRLGVACNDRVLLLDTEQLHVQWQVQDPGRHASFSHVVFSDDGSRLLAGGRSTPFHLCDVGSGKVLQRYVPVTKTGFTVRMLRFSPDGEFATVSGAIGTDQDELPITHARRWSLSTGKVEFRVDLPRRSNVPAMWELPDGRLAVHTLTGIYLYDKGTRNESKLYPLPSGWQSLVSGDRQRYVIAGRDGDVHPCDVRTPDARLGGFAASVMPASGALNDDGSRLLLGGAHGDVQLWQLKFPDKDGRSVATDDLPPGGPAPPLVRIEAQPSALGEAGFVRFDGHAGEILSVAALPDNDHVVTAAADQRVLLWNIGTQRLVRRYHGRGAKDMYFGMAPHPWGEKILISGGQYRPNQTVAWWDLPSLSPQAPFPGVAEPAGQVAVSPDGNWCAAAGHRQDLVLWHAKTRKEKFRAPPRVRRNGLGYFAVEFSSDSKYLIASSQETLSVWSVETGEQVTNRKGQYSQVQVIRARPGAAEALIDTGRAAVLIGIPSLQTIRSFQTQGHFRSAAFSADGRRLAYGGRSVPARVWDLEADQEIYAYEGRVDDLTMTPDGEKLIVVEATTMIAVALP